MKPGALPLPPSIDWTEHMCALPLPPFFICVCLFPISSVRSKANNAFPFFSIKEKPVFSHTPPIATDTATARRPKVRSSFFVILAIETSTL
ncbi:hypothetical protein L2E82_47118 [Cichorium intybus]|uniref:Uncharacterized protein n=1 Tax=Cichorium intybus TaxID=13427 RepID=A0ACB8YV52_CICIN|nr:hypothetical protein L2E82_47118 [Cichorium intybus]